MSETTEQGTLRKLSEADLPLLLSWRNHPEVRRFMFAAHEISLAEHQAWFARVSADAQRHLLVFEIAGQPLGFANVHVLHSAGGLADWGFYVSPEARRGTGHLLGKAVLAYAFENLRIHKMSAQVIAFNERSARFHQRLGFVQEGLLRDQHFDGERHHDVLCFGLLLGEWLDFRRRSDAEASFY